ncbi:hypothetical protein Z043_113405, partial [Scleropages formosus]
MESREQREELQASDIRVSLAGEVETPCVEPAEKLHFERPDEDMRIPGLKLTRVRNPKASFGRSRSRGQGGSRKKRSKFVWTLTVVKSNSKTAKTEESVDFGKTTDVEDIKVEEIKDVPADSWITDSSEKVDNQDAKVDTPVSPHHKQGQLRPFNKTKPKALLSFEQIDVVHAHPEEATQTEEDILMSQEAVPPLQLKLVASPGKQNSMQPSLFISRISPDLGGKELIVGNSSEAPQEPRTLLEVELNLAQDILSQDESNEYAVDSQSVSVSPQEGKSKVLKNIRHFIMPVVSARSSRVIKTPKRFMDDAGMSVLPRRTSPKKGHHFNLQHRSSRKRDDTAVDLQCPDLTAQDEDQAGESSFAEAEDKAQEEKEKSSSPAQSLSDPEKAKLKIEDLDTPGVVRKVSNQLLNIILCLIATSQEVEDTPNQEDDKPDAVAELDQSAESDRVVVEEKGNSHRIRLTGANRRMFHLLKRAKVQLIKIDQQKQLKSSQLLSASLNVGSRDGGLMSAKNRRKKKRKEQLDIPPQDKNEVLQEQQFGGPRIKHVCRDAAVVLGQPRAMVPDDVPRLSALPLHEREKIPPSPMAQDVSPSEPESPTPQDQKMSKTRKLYGATGGRHRSTFSSFGLRSRRYKRCDQIEERKALRLGEKLLKGQAKRRRSSFSACNSSNDEGDATEGGRSSPTVLADGQSPSLRKQPRRCVKPRSYCDLLDYDSDLDMSHPSHAQQSNDDQEATSNHEDMNMALKGNLQAQWLLQWIVPSPVHSEQEDMAESQKQAEGGGEVEKDRLEERVLDGAYFYPSCLLPFQSPLEQTPPSVLAALANGFAQREKEPSQPSHKIRVDFKEDCSLQNVWLMGGLSILTSIPVVPPYVCLLCASKGHHEMLYCQVCCEPFHQFCLEPGERPLEENKENWCCRRCKFCHVCGRRNKHSKPLLECERCQNCYHPSCLGPNYPKPNKKSCNKKSWVCMTCIRCKSCGVTPGKSWDTEWNHERGLCPDCSKLYDQGNYCPICHKCYEDNDYDSQMMQCATCNHWVHAKCEDLS